MRKPGSPLALAAVLLILTFLASLAGCGPRPLSIEDQRRAYQAWYPEVDRKLKAGDSTMQIISELIDGYSKGKFGRYDAYGVAKIGKDNIDALWSYLVSLKLPTGLSSDNAKALTEAMEAFRTAQYSRREGLKALLDFFDSPSPAKLDAASRHLEAATKSLVDAAGKLKVFESKLEAK
jgi:hypothetical protein